MLSKEDKLEKFIVLLKDGTNSQREKCAVKLYKSYKYLGDRGNSALVDALGDSVPEVRLWSLRALNLTKDPRFFEKLPQMLQDENKRIRQEAVEILQKLKPPEFDEVVKECLKMDFSPEVAKKLNKLVEKRGVA